MHTLCNNNNIEVSMKKTLLLTSIVFSALTLSPNVSANDSVGLRVCEYIKANDKSRLRSYLKQQKLRVRNLYDQIKCNDMNLLVFAAANQSLEAGEFLIGKIPAKKVQEEIDNIAKHSAHLAEEARLRVE